MSRNKNLKPYCPFTDPCTYLKKNPRTSVRVCEYYTKGWCLADTRFQGFKPDHIRVQELIIRENKE